MTVLLTGFEPFDGAATNPSWEAVCLTPANIAGHEVHRLCLPVVFGEAAALLKEAIRRLRPQVVICCGVANGRQAVTPELVALNYRHARIPDNAGQSFFDHTIAQDGPIARKTSLPVHAMISAMQAREIPAHLSLSAGAYVCNDVYWALLESEAEFGHKGLFLHVPGSEVVDAAKAAQAIVLCVETALADC